MSATATRGQGRPLLLAAWYGLIVLAIVSVSVSVNRQLVPLVTEPMKRSLSLSDAQIGVLNGFALLLVTALATFPMGWLADRVDRRWLLAVCIAIWSAATVGFGYATSFQMLMIFAMGAAVGEAVLGPLVYSMIPDLFPREKWIAANYVFYVVNLLGASAGLSIGGALLGAAEIHHESLAPLFQTGDPWRIAVITCSFTAPILILLVLMVRLKRRAAGVATQDRAMSGVLGFFRVHARTCAGVFLGFGVTYAANLTMASWFLPAMTRVYGIPPSEVGVTLGVVYGVGAVSGVALSYLLVRLLRPRFGELVAMKVAQIFVLAAIVVTPPLLIASSATTAYILAGLKTAFTTGCFSISPAILQLLAPAHMRGRVIALGGLISLVFASVGPLLIGIVSDNLFPGPEWLMWAIVSVTLPCFVAGLLLLRYGAASLPGTIAASAAFDAGTKPAAI